MNLGNKSSLSATDREVNDAKEKILRSVIVAMDSPETVLKVVNQVLTPEFDVWDSIIEKSTKKTNDAFREKLRGPDPNEYNSTFVQKVVDEVSMIITEFKCFMEGCVTPVDGNASDHAIRLPYQLSSAIKKSQDRCYVALDHTSVSKFYKHLWMQERKDKLSIEVQHIPLESQSSYTSSSEESEDIVDDVTQISDDSFDGSIAMHQTFEGNSKKDSEDTNDISLSETLNNTSPMGNGTSTDPEQLLLERKSVEGVKFPMKRKDGSGSIAMHQAFEGNSKKDSEDMRDISLSETLNNTSSLGNGTSTGPEQLLLERKSVKGVKLPFKKMDRRFYCTFSKCSKNSQSWSSEFSVCYHLATCHRNSKFNTLPCDKCDRKFPTSATLSKHERDFHSEKKKKYC